MTFNYTNNNSAGDEYSSWSFDVSSFLVLLGENEEIKFRHMRRSLPECLCSAPVAGLQSYLKTPNSVFNATGLQYTSPSACKTAPLRNMQLHYCLESKEFLNDGNYTVVSVPLGIGCHNTAKTLGYLDFYTYLFSLFCWTTTACLVAFLCQFKQISWIGLAGCLVLSLYSIILRVSERIYAEPAELARLDKDEMDAVYILGRRNSCFVLEGSRYDIARMTGQGLQMRKGNLSAAVANITRVGTFIVLLFVFAVVPNGTTWDQVAFIALNILGQLNVIIGQKLRSASFFRRLNIETQDTNIKTRTHIYANLIRKFGDGTWVDEVGLLPRTSVWKEWRTRIINEPQKNAKDVYDECNIKSKQS